VAYDEDGKVAGLRKWEAVLAADAIPVQATTPSPQGTGTASPAPAAPAATQAFDDETMRLLSAPLNPGDSLEFSLSVFSLGPRIQRVEVLVEARPVAAIPQD
jgi:hypothetical protein